MTLSAHPSTLSDKPLRIQRALLSVSDKTGIVSLAQTLHERGVEIISTGGTAAALRDAGIPVTDVSQVTGFPECLDGRVKTLHPSIHGALLARMDDPEHTKTLRELEIKPIELVVVNLYPFVHAVSERPDDLAHAIEHIDIGGPAMVRASAKNFAHVCILTSPDQYDAFTEELDRSGGTISASTRSSLCLAAFRHTARYDEAVAAHLGRFEKTDSGVEKREAGDGQPTPEYLSILAPKYQQVRYGENPHQAAAVYGNPGMFFDCFHGKELSYNNYLDLDAALRLGSDFQHEPRTLCAIFKHTLPCGVAIAEDGVHAWSQAFSTDTVSPFGGIVLFNKQVDEPTARAIDSIFTEIVMAPDFTPQALDVLTAKANRRLVRIKAWHTQGGMRIRSTSGGYLLQQDDAGFDHEQRSVVTQAQPSPELMKALEFAWRVVKHVPSNAIVYTNETHTLGIGTGQPNRVASARIAAENARSFGHDLTGCVVASDAFFPFADSIEQAAQVGAKAIIQPGGSIRDKEVIEMADKHNLAMVFTANRHFRH